MDAEPFEKIREMSDALLEHAEDTLKHIQKMVKRLDVQR